MTTKGGDLFHKQDVAIINNLVSNGDEENGTNRIDTRSVGANFADHITIQAVVKEGE